MTSPTQIVATTIERLQSEFGCSYVQVCIEEFGLMRRLGIAGIRPDVPDDSFSVGEAPIQLHLDLSYRPGCDDEHRRETRIFAESVANAVAALVFVKTAEERERGKILICDDDDQIRMLMHHVLERSGFELIEAQNGLIAHARALEFKPDLIVIDWMMPVLDGHDAVVRLKADPFTAATPVVMLTSRSQAADKVLALNAGVQDFLAKPFEPSTLAATIRQQLRWRRLMADERASVVPTALPRETPPDALSLAGFVEIAEAAEERKAYDDAADAYTRAAELATNPDIANKFRRLCGKMYLLLAESATDATTIQRGYSHAARAFLTAGNTALAVQANRSSQLVV